ncbi:hypothetical protein CLF_110986 [Clonorchis sinensis]|uniref:Uncharacterized protein n=1 Tax=Clonorchis sinensis TaxID=79923 RepID=G7YU56_CLOSI|nr:hypothetical protein CLF_110986 [Clonorchis sinensis]
MESRVRAASANLCHSNGDGTARSSRSHRKPQTRRSLSTTSSGIWLDGYTVRRVECPSAEMIDDANPKLDEKGRLRFRRTRPDLQSSLSTGNQSPSRFCRALKISVETLTRVVENPRTSLHLLLQLT